MPQNMTIFDEAISRVELYKQSLNGKENVKYVDTLFVAIDNENKVSHSHSASILSSDSKYAILIHKRKELAVTNWYFWYEIETIDQDLCVRENALDDRYTLWVDMKNSYNNQWISLRIKTNRFTPELIFECKWPEESILQSIWNLYQKCLDYKTTAEACLLGKLAMADKKILKLGEDANNLNIKEQVLTAERDQYKSLLDEIKLMVDTLKTIKSAN